MDQPEGALTKRARQLTRDEMHLILAKLGDAGVYGQVLRWLFWTGCRLNEAFDMRWRDVDLATSLWTVPQTKQGRAHTVPLPRQAIAFLRALDPTGAAVATPDRLVFTGRRGNKLVNWDRATKAVHEASGTGGWHRHDIRRGVASLMGDLGIAPHVIEVALGHELSSSSDGSTLGRVATTYNLSRYRREHADALQQLADELELIEGGAKRIIRLVRA